MGMNELVTYVVNQPFVHSKRETCWFQCWFKMHNHDPDAAGLKKQDPDTPNWFKDADHCELMEEKVLFYMYRDSNQMRSNFW